MTSGTKTVGYDKPLYILPFDHRHSYGEDVFGYHEPMSKERIGVVAASKMVIYDAYKQALAAGAPQDRTGILVDEEFGADILRDARRSGYTFCMPVEKSGQHEFDFEFGDDFAQHVEQFDPTFTKVLVRYNPEGDSAFNQRQDVKLKRLSDYLKTKNRLFMFELLVAAEPAQLAKVGGDKHAYDVQLRPGLMVRAIEQIQDAGIEPDVWKIEGLDRREDCAAVVAAARRAGRSRVGCIVLGRGEDEKRVVDWLRVAAGVPGFTGFAVGRSTFLQSIMDLRAKRISRDQAIAQTEAKFREWIDVFEGARAK